MRDYGHVDDETPSFAISLVPKYRGKGIGTRLRCRNLFGRKGGYILAAFITWLF
jgi:hypothetical protein